MRLFEEDNKPKKGDGPLDTSPSALKRALEAEKRREQRKKEKKKKRKASKEYRKYQQDLLDYKKGRQAWLEKQASQNAQRREEAKKHQGVQATQERIKAAFGKSNVIGEKDSDPKAAGENFARLGRFARGSGTLAAELIKIRHKQKQEKKLQQQGEQTPPDGQNVSKSSRTPLSAVSRRGSTQNPTGGRKPPVRTFRANEYRASRRGPIVGKISMALAKRKLDRSRDKREERRFNGDPSSPYNVIGELKKGNPVMGRRVNPNSTVGTPKRSVKATIGRAFDRSPIVGKAVMRVAKNNLEDARQRRYYGEYYGMDEFTSYLEENYCCWREEFLFELGDLRRKSKKKYESDEDETIDVMKGENDITIGPSVSESRETPQQQFDRRVKAASTLPSHLKIKMLKYAASKYPKVNEEASVAGYMAKATPRITGRTKALSDVHLLKQPGKGTAEQVRDRMRKLFMNEPVDLSPFDVRKESLDDAGFRQHSQGGTMRSTPSDDDGARRRKAALRAIYSLNNTQQPSKKKKKKKKDQ